VAHRVLSHLRDRERSVAWLSRQIGYSVSYTWRVLNGERNATDEFKKRVAAALGVPADELFDERES
jgi:transcriptional regulator with XRE-family HTH domain